MRLLAGTIVVLHLAMVLIPGGASWCLAGNCGSFLADVDVCILHQEISCCCCKEVAPAADPKPARDDEPCCVKLVDMPAVVWQVSEPLLQLPGVIVGELEPHLPATVSSAGERFDYGPAPPTWLVHKAHTELLI